MAFTSLFPTGVPCNNNTKTLFQQWALQAQLSTPWLNGTDLFTSPNTTSYSWAHMYVALTLFFSFLAIFYCQPRRRGVRMRLVLQYAALRGPGGGGGG